MIELSNSTQQTIPVGGAVTFDVVLLKSGCDVCFNSLLPTSVKLNQKRIYDVEFQGNITSNTASAIQLSIAVAGTAIAQTAMDSTPSTANDLNHVNAGTYIRNGCCDIDRVSVVNSGANPIILAPNSLLRVFSI